MSKLSNSFAGRRVGVPGGDALHLRLPVPARGRRPARRDHHRHQGRSRGHSGRGRQLPRLRHRGHREGVCVDY